MNSRSRRAPPIHTFPRVPFDSRILQDMFIDSSCEIPSLVSVVAVCTIYFPNANANFHLLYPMRSTPTRLNTTQRTETTSNPSESIQSHTTAPRSKSKSCLHCSSLKANPIRSLRSCAATSHNSTRLNSNGIIVLQPYPRAESRASSRPPWGPATHHPSAGRSMRPLHDIRQGSAIREPVAPPFANSTTCCGTILSRSSDTCTICQTNTFSKTKAVPHCTCLGPEQIAQVAFMLCNSPAAWDLLNVFVAPELKQAQRDVRT